MLTCWDVSLQVHDFSVVHWSGKRNVIADMLYRLLEFEQSELLHTPTKLAPIYIATLTRSRGYARGHRAIVSARDRQKSGLIPAMGDCVIWGDPLHVSAMNVFMATDRNRLQEAQ